MDIPEIFKYNSLISIPLFAIVALVLVRESTDYFYYKHTISKSVHFLNTPLQKAVFRLNFVVKASLDFGFALFIVDHFQLSFGSFISVTLLSSAVFFGALAYFIEGKYSTPHKLVTYTGGMLWAFGQFAVVRLIDDSGFTFFSAIFLTLPLILAYLFAKKTNVFVQVMCMSIWYIWIIVLIFRYL